MREEKRQLLLVRSQENKTRQTPIVDMYESCRRLIWGVGGRGVITTGREGRPLGFSNRQSRFGSGVLDGVPS